MKRPGRPPLDITASTPSADVHLRLPASLFDEADQHRKLKRESLQDTIRRGLKRLLTEERSEPS